MFVFKTRHFDLKVTAVDAPRVEQFVYEIIWDYKTVKEMYLLKDF